MFHIRHTFVRKLPTQYSETLFVKSKKASCIMIKNVIHHCL